MHGVPGVSPWPDDLDTAAFSGSGSVTAIVLDVNPSLKALSFSGSNYALSGGSLTLDSNTGTATVTVSSGTQSIASMVTLSSNLSVAPAAGSQLTISGNVGEASPRQALSLTGAGRLILSGADSYNGGTNVRGRHAGPGLQYRLSRRDELDRQGGRKVDLRSLAGRRLPNVLVRGFASRFTHD